MKLWSKLTAAELRELVEAVSMAEYNGNVIFKREPETDGRALQFTLTVKFSGGRGGRLSHTGRRVAAACWHAHRDIMLAIFTADPDARLKTALADYRGADSFAAEFEATGYKNIGSQFQPCMMREACECER